VAECTACELAASRTHTVFGEGSDQADWLFIGEAPGQQEDRQGKPFVGRAGGLLTQMIRALDKTREQVFIMNTLKCRPPGNRDPLPAELKACEPFLLKQIQLIQPKVIVALGKTSAQALLNSDQALGKLRGQVYQYGPDNIPLIVSYHPAYLLRQPADKGKVWADLLLAHRQLPV
jgi:DNA polymerase